VTVFSVCFFVECYINFQNRSFFEQLDWKKNNPGNSEKSGGRKKKGGKEKEDFVL
jgi:hypothetical protein